MFTKQELEFIAEIMSNLSFKTGNIGGHVNAHNILLKINQTLKPAKPEHSEEPEVKEEEK